MLKSQRKRLLFPLALVVIPFVIYLFVFHREAEYMASMGSYIPVMLAFVCIHSIVFQYHPQQVQFLTLSGPFVAAFRKDGVRSQHPTHSVAVFGKGAEEYIAAEGESKTPAPVNGWMSRFCKDKGKILLLGVGQDKNTFIHWAEERIDVPDRISKKPYDVTVIDKYGNSHIIENLCSHHTEALNGESCSVYYPNYEKPFAYHNAIIYSHLGDARVSCCDAFKITKIVEELWKRTDHDLCISNDEIPIEYYKDVKF